MQIELLKGHGSGNDFLIIDEITNHYTFSEKDRVNLAKLLCNRKTELGADGILFVMNSDHADAKMRVFNADGSEASMCGNGLRLVARFICELQEKNEAVIETMKADLKVGKRDEIFPNIHTYQVEISPVLFDVKALPLNWTKPVLVNEEIPGISDELKFTALAVPNPHLIAIVETEQLNSELQKELSEELNRPNDICPDGVNVSFVKPLGSGAIYVRTFERGVGFTNACGTAMSASSLVTCLQGLNEYESVIQVYNNGGKVQCVVHHQAGDYNIDLIGNATYLYRAAVTIDIKKEAFTVTSKQELPEQQSYEKLQTEVQRLLKEKM